MIKALLSTATLCAGLLSATSDPFTTTEGLGRWKLECEANAVECQVSQLVLSESDPGRAWLNLGLLRDGHDVALVVITPPLAHPTARVRLDQTIKMSWPADRCDAIRCVFVQRLNQDGQALWTNSERLDFEVLIGPGRRLNFTVDLRQLATALKKLPVEL